MSGFLKIANGGGVSRNHTPIYVSAQLFEVINVMKVVVVKEAFQEAKYFKKGFYFYV